MILQDQAIVRLIEEKELYIMPFSRSHIQPASYDVTLGPTLKMLAPPVGGVLKLDEEVKYIEYKMDLSGYLLMPGEFVLGTTEEWVQLPSYINAVINGRSSIGRVGLFSENAGYIDPGFKGHITLEIFNCTRFPLLLKPGRRVAQLVFGRLEAPCDKPYQGKYQGQHGATGSRIFQDDEVSMHPTRRED